MRLPTLRVSSRLEHVLQLRLRPDAAAATQTDHVAFQKLEI